MFKRIFLSLLLVVFYEFLFAQTPYEVRLNELKKEIEEAVYVEDYKIADKLNKEKNLLLLINQALLVNDTLRVKQLQEELVLLNSLNKEQFVLERSYKSDVSHVLTSLDNLSKDREKYTEHLRSGWCLESGLGLVFTNGQYYRYEYIEEYSDWNYEKKEKARFSIISPIINFRVSNLAYFNKPFTYFRFGMKSSPISVDISLNNEGYFINLAIIGPYFSYEMKEKSTLEMGLTIGLSFCIDYSFMPGYISQYELMYRYKRFGFGLDVRYLKIDNYEQEYNEYLQSIGGVLCFNFKF